MNELEPEQACRLLTICPSSGVGSPKNSKVAYFLDRFADRFFKFLCILQGPSTYLQIKPDDSVKATKLVPAEPVEEIESGFLVGQDESNSLLDIPALPSERLIPTSVALMGPRKPSCMLCEYVLHEIVNDLRNITVKEEIEAV